MHNGRQTDRQSIGDQVRSLFSMSSSELDTHKQVAATYLREFLLTHHVSAASALDSVDREITGAFADSEPLSFADYLDFVRDHLIPQSTNLASPRCLGHMTSAVPGFVGPLSELVIGLNQNLVKRDASRAFSALERESLAILHRYAYAYPKEFYAQHTHNGASTLGIFTSGATLSNITALWIARNLTLGPRESFAGAEEEGLSAALAYYNYQGAVIVCSSFAHYSVQKAAGILGIGERGVLAVPVDRHGRMDVRALERIVENCRRQDTYIQAIVATAGTTDCGSIDPLNEIAEIASGASAYLHVDAAWGGPLLFSRQHRRQLAGLARADSVTIDAHKQLYLPIGNSVLLLREPGIAGVIEKQTRYMLQECSGDLGKRSIEGSRPGWALLLHAALQIIGPAGYEFLVEDSIRKVNIMLAKLRSTDAFEVLIAPETNIVLYRYTPPALRAAVREGRLSAGENEWISQVNERLQKTQGAAGQAFVSRTTIHNLYGGLPVVALRAVLANPRTEEPDIEFVLHDQIQIGDRISRELATARSRAAT